MPRSPIFLIAAGLLLLPPTATALAQQGGGPGGGPGGPGGGGQQPVLDALQAHDANIDGDLQAHDAKLQAHAAAMQALYPSPIDACTTITEPGSYVLTQNLTTAFPECLVVAADFITIDLGGWTITGAGNGSGSGIGDVRVARRGITVRNGTITGFAGGGVNLPTTTGAIVEAVQAVDNFFAGIITGAGGIITGNIVEDNENGITAGRGSTVTGNTVRDSARGIIVGPDSVRRGCPRRILHDNAGKDNAVYGKRGGDGTPLTCSGGG